MDNSAVLNAIEARFQLAQLAGRSIFGHQSEHIRNSGSSAQCQTRPGPPERAPCANFRMRNTGPSPAKTSHYGAGKSVANL
jgi:hypothetical protein